MKKENRYNGYILGEEFHKNRGKVYSKELGWAVNKKHKYMAKVLYEPVHENKAFEGEKRGKGKNFATWILSEEEGIKEGIFSTNFELMIDARLEPNASIGLHYHTTTEEVYYILEGTIDMVTVSENGDEFRQKLCKGDAHFVKLKQGHYGTAGKKGVRFIAVAVRK